VYVCVAKSTRQKQHAVARCVVDIQKVWSQCVNVSALARSMARLPMPPKLPRLEPSADASALQLLQEAEPLPLLPPPALATWGRLALVRFYNAHQDLKLDLLKKRTRGVCSIRFRQHCERIPQRVRQMHKVDLPAEGGPGRKQNGRAQSSMCRRIDELLGAAMAFWGDDCVPLAASEC
jgi:hypothetical protein